MRSHGMATGAVDINMFMYNNSMSMNGIDFAFNVGTAATELVATSDTVDHAGAALFFSLRARPWTRRLGMSTHVLERMDRGL